MVDTCPSCGSSTEQPCYADCSTNLKAEITRLTELVVWHEANNARFHDVQSAHLKDVERLRSALTADDQTLRLHLGEMTAQEMRTLRAGFQWVLARAVTPSSVEEPRT